MHVLYLYPEPKTNTMTALAPTEDRVRIRYLKTHPQTTEALAAEVRKELEAKHKSLPSKLFYDDAGSALFARIMRMPEYYPAPAERQIFEEHAPEIVAQMPDRPFILMDLGSGDGSKTKLLLEEMLRQGKPFRYMPVDISAAALKGQLGRFQQELPSLDAEGMVGDFFTVMAAVRRLYPTEPIFALFLGGNIGNFEEKRALGFLRTLFNLLAPGDKLLCGFDLQKDPDIIRLAYDDPAGITAAFNYNMLIRLNRELGADFQIENFVHYATYNPLLGAARSYLLSTKKQQIWVDYWKDHVRFEAWEAIHTENSYKYTLAGIEDLASRVGFETVTHLLDDRAYFTDAIWQRK